MKAQPDKRKPFTIRDLLRPYTKALVLGALAPIGDGVANLLEPWPVKVVLERAEVSTGPRMAEPLDSIPRGWEDKLAILKLAAAARLQISKTLGLDLNT